MRVALAKAEIEANIASRFENAFRLQEKRATQTLAAGIAEVDALTAGIPRGAISEIFGPASSGRTSLLLSMIYHATMHDEICALVDINDVFAPTAAALAGIDFNRLLWVRCGANLEHGFKATDLLLHAGGFGLVILDMGDVAGKDARRIISSWWYRFRRTIENKPTALVVISAEACTRSCSSLTLELDSKATWITTSELQNSGAGKDKVSEIRRTPGLIAHANLLRASSVNIHRRRPMTGGASQTEFISSNF